MLQLLSVTLLVEEHWLESDFTSESTAWLFSSTLGGSPGLSAVSTTSMLLPCVQPILGSQSGRAKFPSSDQQSPEMAESES